MHPPTLAPGHQNTPSDQNKPLELFSIDSTGGRQRWLVRLFDSRAENEVRTAALGIASAAQIESCFPLRARVFIPPKAAVRRLLTNVISGIGFTVAWQFLQDWIGPTWHR